MSIPDPVIEVTDLSEHYRIFRRDPGFLGTLTSLVNRKYETVYAVDGISFTVSEGELVGFIGPNGAGKTTTMKCLSGLLYPTSGRVRVLGWNPYERHPQFLKRIALVMGQKNQLWWDLPAEDTILLYKEIYEIPDDTYRKTLGELVGLLSAEKLLRVPVRKLSLGERMKMELIAALIHSPRVLFLDEPTIGLDVVMQKQVRDFIRDYNRKFRSTVLLTSHYMEDVKSLAERVIIINMGKLLYDGSLARLVARHADYKQLTVVFGNGVTPKRLETVGTVVSLEFPRVVIRVPRSRASEAASLLLTKYPIEDLTVEEPDVEDVVRDIFLRKKK